MKVVRLYNPFPNGFSDEDAERAGEVLEEFKAVYDAIVSGMACVRFFDGDRNGSVARLAFDESYIPSPPTICANYYNSWDRHLTQQLDNEYFSCVAKWDGRRNKVKLFLPNHETEFLLDYEDGTVWEKFDAKAAKDDLLKNPEQKDIHGKVLSVGDRVLYINARYGSRMTLEEGTVREFLASVNSKGHTISTVIESKTGEESNLQYPESMVFKFKGDEK